MIETAHGWQAEPDLRTAEHDVLTAMLELAWHDVQIDLGVVPCVQRDEAVAAKITAYEWIAANDTHLTSFRSVCLHVGIRDVSYIRRVMLWDKRVPEPGTSFLREVELPDEPVPPRWLEEFARTTREDRDYIKRKPPRQPRPALPAPSSEPPAPASVSSPEPPCDCPNPPCAALDGVPQPPFTLEALIAEVNVSGQAAADTEAEWVAAAAAEHEGREEGD